jgi:hypothetical protein
VKECCTKKSEAKTAKSEAKTAAKAPCCQLRTAKNSAVVEQK